MASKCAIYANLFYYCNNSRIYLENLIIYFKLANHFNFTVYRLCFEFPIFEFMRDKQFSPVNQN